MGIKGRILVIDDDPLVRGSCQRVLGENYSVRLAATGREGLQALAKEPFDAALVDLKLPDVSGLDILQAAPDRFPDVPVIIITGYSTIRNAVEAIKMGAFDYVPKPFTPDELEASVEKALRQRRLLKDYRHLQAALSESHRGARLVGESPAMRKVLSLIEEVAPTDSTVLLVGESGTGKELVARAIHFASPRREGRFVAADCGAITPSLVAGELFGHVKGAFTGAVTASDGLIRAAHEGTLFLDEIGCLPLDLQPSLLRAIDGREVRPIGANAPTPVDVRYIAATNRDLRELVGEGRFREDLFYRLNVFPIRLPPLRERREDIPLLARHFLALFSTRMHRRVDDFTPEAMRLLVEYDWPGNVRELSNVVERLVILCGEGRVGQSHLAEVLPPSISKVPVPQTGEELNAAKKELRERTAADLEKSFLIEALRRNEYNVTRAAQQTGMQRSHFQALLKKHGLRLRDLAASGGEAH